MFFQPTKRGTTFIFESAMEEDMFNSWSEWGSCKAYTCHQKRTRTCKTDQCFGSSDDNQICAVENTWQFSLGFKKYQESTRNLDQNS